MLNKSLLLGISFTLLNLVSVAQTTDFTLLFDFDLDLDGVSSVKITKKQNSNSVELWIGRDFRQETGGIRAEKAVPDSDLKVLSNFLKTYSFQITGGDWLEAVKKNYNGKDTIVYVHNTITDGWGVNGEFIQNNTSHKFAFWSPRKQSENYRFVKIISDILNKTFTEGEAAVYAKKLVF